jgi:hypothetical protein
MGLAEMFGWSSAATTSDELPEIFPMNIEQAAFVETDVVHIYSKILTDVIERTSGLSDDQLALLWDNCLMSTKLDGLITMLAKAMADKKELFIVYEKSVGVIRPATADEQQQIRRDYEKSAKSSVGVFLSFKNYKRSDMVKLYSALDYATVSSLMKSMNLSKAIQLKFNELRAGVALNDSSEAKKQALAIAQGLMKGRDIMLDAKDEVETAKPDLTAVQSAIEFVNEKRAFYLGLPAAYITGEQTGGLGTTGENDTKATERGLKNYFESIMRPVLKAVLNVNVKYKSQDIGQINQGLEVLKTFELTSEQFVSSDNKKRIVEGIFDLDPNDNETEDPPKEVVNGNGKAGAPGAAKVPAVPPGKATQ